MNIFIARQPIFNNKLETYGYELLYRGNVNNQANFYDGNAATANVIINSLTLLGLEKISDKKLSFVNFTKDLIEEETVTLFSPDSLFIEIMEDIKPDESFLEACSYLKTQGYKFALDDYVFDNYNESLLKIADIVKVDFIQTTKNERRKIAIQLKPFKTKLLAEKIETHAEFEEAKELGYTYFQGYFFEKPQIVEIKEIGESLQTYIRILKELNKSTVEFLNITRIVETDVSLAYKILRLVNSPAFYKRKGIASINQALVRLGFKEIKKVVSILMLRNINSDKPIELVKTALMRAKFAEYIAIGLNEKERSSEFFIVGLFSTIDALMDQSMENIMKNLPLEEGLKDALVGKKNIITDVIDIIKLYEKGNWEVIFKKSKIIGIDDYILPELYLKAISWSNQAMSEI